MTGTSLPPNDGSTLVQSWPRFLDQLDRDPDRAFESFYSFARRVLSVCPPSAFRSVPIDRREDLVHEIILHCCRNDFRVLRSYQKKGRPFAAWFQTLARNKALDSFRVKTETPFPNAAGEDGPPSIEEILPDRQQLPDRVIARKTLLEIVGECVGEMGENCRLLLAGSAEGLKPRELTALLGWPDSDNKKASDALRECRRQLKRRIRERGVDLQEISMFMKGNGGKK